ncbi:MAG: ABC transporter ATP-binding protein [Desulfonatronovibrionaceae bacterium]
MNDPVYSLEGMGRRFVSEIQDLTILNRIDIRVRPGETMAVLGASGSGKSTLLHIMGGLDKPSWGKILFAGRDMNRMGPDELAAFRSREIGFVFQFHHLLAEFNALENAAMPAIIAGTGMKKAKDLAQEALQKVGLEHRGRQSVNTLSGGERQRVAIARAVLMQPRVVLADEPTGDLDEKTGNSIKDLLLQLNQNLGTTLVLATHNRELAAAMQTRYEMHSGELHALD